MRALLFLSLLLLPSCSFKEAQNCAVPWAGFYSWHDRSFWESKGIPAVAIPANVIKVERSGRVTWNGVDVNTLHGYEPTLDAYLAQVAQMVPQPDTSLDFDAGAPCTSITKIRQLMMKHLQCDAHRVCLQGPQT